MLGRCFECSGKATEKAQARLKPVLKPCSDCSVKNGFKETKIRSREMSVHFQGLSEGQGHLDKVVVAEYISERRAFRTHPGGAEECAYGQD